LSISGKIAEYTPEKTLEKFSELFTKNIKDMKKKLKTDWKNIILVRDCPRDKIWRNDIYSEYKKTRDIKRSPNFDPIVFSHSYNVIVPQLVKEFGIVVSQFERAEADDIIAVLHNDIRAQSPSAQICIISLDSDFLQLHSKHTDIMDFQLKPLRKKMTDEDLACYITWKIIRGDDSDNIPPIDKKIGDVTAKKLACNPDALNQKLQSSVIIKENFERNKVLIDFSCIPESLKRGILAQFYNKKFEN
jgi:5'-3' exonuclease